MRGFVIAITDELVAVNTVAGIAVDATDLLASVTTVTGAVVGAADLIVVNIADVFVVGEEVAGFVVGPVSKSRKYVGKY